MKTNLSGALGAYVELFDLADDFVQAIRPTINDRLFSTRQKFYRLEEALYGRSSEPFLHEDGAVKPKEVV